MTKTLAETAQPAGPVRHADDDTIHRLLEWARSHRNLVTYATTGLVVVAALLGWTRFTSRRSEAAAGEAPLLSVYGGKITTYRRLAEEALGHLTPTFPHMRGPWTRTATLPGGDIRATLFDEWQRSKAQRYPFLDAILVERLCRAYGTRVDFLLNGV